MHVNTNIKIKLLSNFYFKNVNQCLLDVECSSWTSWMFKWLMILITLVIYDFFTIRNSSNLWTITKDLSSHVHCGHLMSSSVVLLLRFFFLRVFVCFKVDSTHLHLISFSGIITTHNYVFCRCSFWLCARREENTVWWALDYCSLVQIDQSAVHFRF